jgi:hypothetical protein
MSRTIDVASLIEKLAHNPDAHGAFAADERQALASLHDALGKIRREEPKASERAPSADGAQRSGDRPVGGTPSGWQELTPAPPPPFPFTIPGGRTIMTAGEGGEIVDMYDASRHTRSPEHPEPEWVEELRARLEETSS